MANYTETFSGQTTGANSTTFTNRYASETSISVENPAILEQDDRVLRFSTGDSGYQLQSMDSVDSDGNRANCEILARFRQTNDDDNNAWLFARASGSATSETAYGMHIRSTGDVNIVRLNSATYTILDSVNADLLGASPWANFLGDTFTYLPTNTWLWMRLRVNGTGTTVTVQGKFWVDGQEEPTDWNLSADDTSASRITAAGWCGFGRLVHTGTVYLDMFAVGTNGDTAVAATSTTPVRVSQSVAQVLYQDNATPVRVSNMVGEVLYQNNATPVRVTNVSAQVLYTVAEEAATGQTVVAFIGTG